MPLSKTDRQRIKEVNRILTGPATWSRNAIARINKYSGDSLTKALAIGKDLDYALRHGQIQLTKQSFAERGIDLSLDRAKVFVSMATHKSYCESGPLYRDQRRYGTREGEQKVINLIRRLHTQGKKSYRQIIELLHAKGIFSRRGKWNLRTICAVMQNAKGTLPRKPCTCRMFRGDWVPPRTSSACFQMLQLSDRLFEGMLAARRNHYDTTIADIIEFRQSLVAPPAYIPPVIRPDHSYIPNINTVVFGDCRKRLLELPANSISLVVTSPPYGEQRPQYAGSPAADYPAFTLSWMTPLKRALKDDGSVFIIIRPHVENGVEIDYLAPTINVVEASGWILIQRLIWYKPDAGPFGAEELPRRNYEYILWFAKTNKPYINLTAGGNPTKRKDTRRRGGRHGNLHADSSSPVAEGVARVTDVIVALVGEIDKVNHPAMFPPTLGRKLIPPFAPSYSLIVDPFAGAGTTCLVAQSLDYDFWGCDNGYEIIGENADGSPIYGDSFATIANRRLKTEAKYARGAAVALAGDALAVAAMAKGASA